MSATVRERPTAGHEDRPAPRPRAARRGGPAPDVVRIALDALLTIEGFLGVAAVAGDGAIVACIDLDECDAAALCQMVSSAVRGFDDVTGHGVAGGDGLAFATFALREGQIAVSSGPRLSLIVLTEPDLDPRAIRGALAELLVELEALDEGARDAGRG